MLPIVAIVGRPNVGKSTLFNRIVGVRLAITLDVPGVTRDRHYGRAAWEGRNFLCVDTGGLVLDEAGSLEKKVREQVDLALREAAVILMVMDGRAGLLPEEQEIGRTLRRSGKKVFYVINKIDDVGAIQGSPLLAEFYTLGEEIWPVSSEHGIRVNDLLDGVVAALPPATKESREERIKVSLVGRPNVGKSSLLNRLLGEERVIVHDRPGTTRDVIDTPFRNYLMIDTAGIRRGGKSASKVERYSVLNALKAIGRSDVCLLLLDASEGIHKQDAHVAGTIQEAKKGVVFVWNKWDLMKDSREGRKKFIQIVQDELGFFAHVPVLFLSAATGKGCDKIWPAVDRIYEASGHRVPTSRVNDCFEVLIGSHNPPVFKGKPVKFFYATQTATFPPTFVIFTSEPGGVHFSFKRYLENGFREAFGFEGVPLQLVFRKKR